MKTTSNLKLLLSNKNQDQQLIGYADAIWAEERTDRKSNSGRIFFYNGGTISWSCQKQNLIASSTCEAQYISLSKAAKWLRQLLTDLHIHIEEPTIIFNDNQSCLRLLNDDKFSFKTKHMDTKYKITKDLVKNGIITSCYCPTEDMMAYILTKPLSPNKHNYFCNKCNLRWMRRSVGVITFTLNLLTYVNKCR